jgi:hypothetical protein
MQRFFLPIVLLVTLALVGCPQPKEEPRPDVILLHSGRIRGNVFPLTLQNISPLQHYQYLAGYVKAVRAEAAKSGARVVLVDLGDSLSGSFASHVTDSMNMVTFFNEAGYDAVMLSNLDADVPAGSIAKIRAKVLNPFVGPDGNSTVPGTAAGVRIDIGGLPVDLLANFYGDTSPQSNPGRFPARFGDVAGGVRPVRDYGPVVAALGPRPKDGLTLFEWMKFDPADHPPAAFLETLRKAGVDAILAHRIYGTNQREAWQSSGFVDWSPPVSFNILRNNGGFVLARMDLARDGNGWKVLRHELLPMTANKALPDAGVVKAIESYSAPITASDTMLFRLADPVDQERILDIYMAAVAGIDGTQAVAYSPDSIRSDWPAGDLRASGVFNSLPWTSGLVQIPLDAAQVRQLPSLAGLRVLIPADLTTGPVTVTTSRFFATLIQGKLGLPDDTFVPLPQSSEFDFFTSYLKSQAAVPSGEFPPGWEMLNP